MWLVHECRDRAYSGTEETENPLQEETRITLPLLTADLRLTERIGIQAGISVPDITRSAVIGSAGETRRFSETFAGVGDTSVLAWYRLSPIRRFYIVLNGGMSLPTGRTEAPRFRDDLQDGSLVPRSRLQRGSGTLDPVLGMSTERRVGTYNVFTSVAARLPVSENRHGLRTGVSAETSAGLSHELFTHTVAGYARIGWLHREQDRFRGTPVLVGGGDWVYLTPGIAVQPMPRFSIQAEVKLPVYRNLDNRQLDSRAVFQVGISRAF